KDTNQQLTSNEKNSEYTPEALAIWHKLVIFNEKMKTGSRDNEVISADSAIWYLETMFNVQQATDTTFGNTVCYKKNYSLEVDEDGLVGMDEVTSVYSQMVLDLETELDQINSDFKYLIIADLGSQAARDGNLTLELTGSISRNPLQLYDPITEDDNWRYGNMLGECVNPHTWSDAGIQLSTRMNDPHIEIQFPHNSWINIVNSGNIEPSSFPSRLFSETASSPPCLEYTELRNYLEQGYYFIYNHENETPSGFFPTTDDMYFQSMTLWTNNPNPPDGKYWHKYIIFYGTPIYIPPIE
ncbi:MAG: hypothetical protein Q8O72_04835, partial [Bacteroidales bacterium]|nr:hypothetical protein [Bacteroidales bacterium]